jgi:ABC-type Na+ transport system ATPase subunit NatA
VYEHLVFYARIKGVEADQENARVTAAVVEVQLGDSLHVRAMDLSGGMRRRLSLAIALIGDPAVVFLDEPTTGYNVYRHMICVVPACSNTNCFFHMIFQTGPRNETQCLGPDRPREVRSLHVCMRVVEIEL